MTTTRSITPAVSDLFFNHRLDAYDELYQKAALTKDWPTSDLIRAAVLADATAFCALVHAAYGITEDPAALVEDFMGRV